MHFMQALSDYRTVVRFQELVLYGDCGGGDEARLGTPLLPDNWSVPREVGRGETGFAGNESNSSSIWRGSNSLDLGFRAGNIGAKC